MADAKEEIDAFATPRQRGINRVVDIFEALRQEGRPMRTGDVATRIAAPRSTVYEIINRLVDLQIFEHIDGGRIYFGRAMYLYGRAYADANPFYLRSREVLERLALENGATTQLCVLKGHRCVVLDERVGHSIFRIATKIGVEIPVPWTASGRLLLDHMRSEEIRALIPAEDFQLPDGSLSPPERFIAEVSEARRRGCFANKLPGRSVYCLAAPIRDPAGITTATLCFVVSIDSDASRRESLLEVLVHEATILSREL